MLENLFKPQICFLASMAMTRLPMGPGKLKNIAKRQVAHNFKQYATLGGRAETCLNHRRLLPECNYFNQSCNA